MLIFAMICLVIFGIGAVNLAVDMLIEAIVEIADEENKDGKQGTLD